MSTDDIQAHAWISSSFYLFFFSRQNAMHSLLGMKKHMSLPSLIGGRWHNLRPLLARNLQGVINYYQSKVRYLPAGHTLERLLILNPINYELPMRLFIDQVESVTDRLAQSARMNTYIQTGLQDHSQMYNSDIVEFFFAHKSTPDLANSVKNWKSLESVTIVYHPCTDVGLYPLVGERSSSDEGYAVIAVNIPMLLMQYKLYKEEMAKLGVSGARSDFLFRYPLLNALKSHYDLAILNRMYNRLHKIVNSDPMKKHPFAFNDWSGRLDQFQDEQIRLIQTRSYDLDSVMINIPLITKNDMRDAMQLPSVPSTRQILWLQVISRIKYIRMVLELSSEKSLDRDRSELATIKRRINMYRTDNAFKSYLPQYLYENLQMDFDALLKIIDR